ncbi:HDOD domain-containing protein [Gallaecimonas kandeliae]|uniref:HDOD domain-containing protein n=1 Tax=Gallaecimonas kandeliae TaxID=3029055 RepID=UPI00264A1725|nr:HDOD domain-containing protein [Gallaecimonas kandeliae]WKE64941.1 HDOD domain-containing protein [Gallaecimonas kandeliae]
MQLQDCFSKPHLLPHIPEVVQDLIATFEQPDPDLNRIVTDLEQDPVLSAKVLRLANSSRFGGVREISSVREAAIRLGLDRLRTLVIASGLTFATKSVEGIDIQAFWKNSFMTAEVCRFLAVAAGLPAEQHFTCGMLHDLGLLILVLTLPNKADDARALALRQGRAEAEQAVLGFTTADIGAELAYRWQFPEIVVAGLRQQFAPLAAERFSSEAAILYLSNWLLALPGPLKEAPEIWPQKTAQALGLDWAALNAAHETVLREGSPFLIAV